MIHLSNGAFEPFESISEGAIGKDALDILIDGRSASASEIVAFDLGDSRRARLVGVPTAGSVVAATAVGVGGGVLEITVALVEVGPSNKRLDKVGVKPDLFADLDETLLAREGRDSQLAAAVADVSSRLRR